MNMNRMMRIVTNKNGPFYRSPEQLLYHPYHNAHVITKTHCTFQPHVVNDDNDMTVTPTTRSNGTISSSTTPTTQSTSISTLSKFIESCATGSKYENYTSIPTTYYSHTIHNIKNTLPQLPSHLSGINYLVRNPYINIIGHLMKYQRNQWLRSSDLIDHQQAQFFHKK